jgi:hypothetical protein
MDNEKAMIYHVGIRVTWKKMRGKSYTNMWRGSEQSPVEVVTRNETIQEMNKNPMLISQIMTSLGATGKSIQDFHIVAEYGRKALGRSNFYEKGE